MLLCMMEEPKEVTELYKDEYQIAYTYDICQSFIEKGIEVTLSNINKILKEVGKYVKEA